MNVSYIQLGGAGKSGPQDYHQGDRHRGGLA